MKTRIFTSKITATAFCFAVLFCLSIAANAATTAQRESGIASFYGAKYQGKPTASGEIFDMYKLTAAHPTLAFGTIVKVTSLENHCSVIVRINDRGPFVGGRAIDLSQAAAEKLQMVHDGLARVKIEIVR
jgi:rare lipoprotein A